VNQEGLIHDLIPPSFAHRSFNCLKTSPLEASLGTATMRGGSNFSYCLGTLGFPFWYGLIPMKIPFLGEWTSINPSYFDVNYRGTRFWHTAICESVNKTLSRRFIAETTTYKRGFSITLLKPEGISVSPWVELVISSPRFYHWISLTSWLLDSPTWNHVTLVRFSCFPYECYYNLSRWTNQHRTPRTCI